MGHIDDAAPLRLQAADRREQMLRLPLADRRGRLIHEDDLGIVAERLGDLDELHLRDREVHHVLRGANVEFEIVQQLLRGPVHRAEIDAAEPRRGLAAEIDVLGDRHVRNRAEFLLDDGDAGGQCVGGTCEFDLLAAAADRAGIAAEDAHQDLEKGRFAGAVAAAERMNRAGAKLKAAVAQGGDATKGLLQPFHLEQKFHVLSSRASGNPWSRSTPVTSVLSIECYNSQFKIDKCQVVAGLLEHDLAR